MCAGATTRQVAVCSSWVLGGVAVGVVGLEYLWRSNLTTPFRSVALTGEVLLVLSAIWTARFAASAGSRLPYLGLLLGFVGFLTLFFGIGAILLLAGVVLYVAGLHRSEVVGRHALYLAALLLVAALTAAIALESQVAGIELAAGAAVVTGLGVVVRERSHHPRKPD